MIYQTQLQNNLSAKLQDKWIGPYYIHNVLQNGTYKLRTMEGQKVKQLLHGNHLKLYKKR